MIIQLEERFDRLEQNIEALNKMLHLILDEVQATKKEVKDVNEKLDKLNLRQNINTLTIREHEIRIEELEAKVS